mgnify:CR=1 FL=1
MWIATAAMTRYVGWYQGPFLIGRKSPLSLYDEEVASMEGTESDYQPEDAGGFIRLHALRLRQRYRKQGYRGS